jgi:hypothetical protein
MLAKTKKKQKTKNKNPKSKRPQDEIIDWVIGPNDGNPIKW